MDDQLQKAIESGQRISVHYRHGKMQSWSMHLASDEFIASQPDLKKEYADLDRKYFEQPKYERAEQLVDMGCGIYDVVGA